MHRGIQVEFLEARAQASEQERIKALISMIPAGLSSALDIGARDGYLSAQLASLVPSVTALDIERPHFDIPRVTTVGGDARQLQFTDDSFDLVFCAEVLEHVAEPGLQAACREIARVSRKYVLIGVPYRQDIRVGRTTCGQCGERNPPWGHVNAFDERRLLALFPGLLARKWSFVGKNIERTNFLSACLHDWAGNPWGTYDQDESCVACGAKLVRPAEPDVARRFASKAAVILDQFQRVFVSERANWVHILFEKPR